MKNKLPLILIAILIVLVGIAGFMFTKNNFSRDAMKLEIIGPDELTAGSEQEFIVKFKNNGDGRLEDLRLNIEFPQNTYIADKENSMVIAQGDELNNLYPGEERSYKIKARLMGKEGDSMSVKVNMTYIPKGLTSRYSSKTEKEVRIKEIPISFEYDAPSRIETGKDLPIELNYFSKLDFPLSNLVIRLSPPEGFDFLGSKPSPIEDDKIDKEWDIDSLNQNNGGRIAIDGVLYGQAGDTKRFQAVLGIMMGGEFVELRKQDFDIRIKDSLMEVSQTVNGKSQYFANMGEQLNYQVNFKNTGDITYKDINLAIKLKGDLYDFSTITAEGAQVKEGDSTIIWTGDQIPDLKILAPGESGSVKFSIKVKSLFGRRLESPILASKAIVNEVQQELRTKVNSEATIKTRAMAHDEVFDSAGPTPLEVGKKSELTVIWDLYNYFNDLENVKVKGILPSNVSYNGKVAPEAYSNNFTFDSASRELVLNVGDLKAGAGINAEDKKVLTFQINITPTADQKNQYALLVKSLKITGTDKWTGEQVQYSIEDLTSRSIVPLDQDESKVK
jgi:hypothetical protein